MNFDENNDFQNSNENEVNSNSKNANSNFDNADNVASRGWEEVNSNANSDCVSNETNNVSYNSNEGNFNTNGDVRNNVTGHYYEGTNTNYMDNNPNSNAYYANNTQNMSEEDYKNNIKRMKQDYKQFQKDQRNAAKAESMNNYTGASKKRRGLSKIASVFVSVLSSIIVFSIMFAIVAFFPSKDKSLLSHFYSSSVNVPTSGETTNPNGNDVEIENNVVSKGDNVTINIEGESDVARAVYAKAANSVVGISVVQLGGSKWDRNETVVSMGSGIIYSADGVIVTNHHVVENAIDSTTGKINNSFDIKVYFNTDLTEWSYATELIGYDAENDIAVLRVNARNLQPIEFADSDELETGEIAISIGSPGGLSYMNSISEGILSGINRTVNTGTTIIYDLIQTTAAINPGNSGGALLNSEGKLIGICVIKIAAADYESMGFAINSNTVKTIVESIKKYGYYNKPLLGITVNTTYSAGIAKEQGWENGAYIEEVSPRSAADKAGILAGDIITAMNGEKISNFAELRRFLLDCEPGDVVEVTVYNTENGETRKVSVTLDESKR